MCQRPPRAPHTGRFGHLARAAHPSSTGPVLCSRSGPPTGNVGPSAGRARCAPLSSASSCARSARGHALHVLPTPFGRSSPGCGRAAPWLLPHRQAGTASPMALGGEGVPCSLPCPKGPPARRRALPPSGWVGAPRQAVPRAARTGRPRRQGRAAVRHDRHARSAAGWARPAAKDNTPTAMQRRLAGACRRCPKARQSAEGQPGTSARRPPEDPLTVHQLGPAPWVGATSSTPAMDQLQHNYSLKVDFSEIV